MRQLNNHIVEYNTAYTAASDYRFNRAVHTGTSILTDLSTSFLFNKTLNTVNTSSNWIYSIPSMFVGVLCGALLSNMDAFNLVRTTATGIEPLQD